jgi:hypothetical protein
MTLNTVGRARVQRIAALPKTAQRCTDRVVQHWAAPARRSFSVHKHFLSSYDTQYWRFQT